MIPRAKHLRALILGATMSIGLVVGTLAPHSVLAQAGLGTLSGTVTDSTHAVVPGATVTLINKGTGFERSVVTSGNGTYRFFALEVTGGYSLKVAAAGFKTAELKGISTSVGTIITVDVPLTIGSAVDTVEVTATQNVEQVQTETSSLSELIDSEIWQSSPLEDRTQNSFVNLTAGATPDTGTGRGSAVDGARTGTGNFLVDGMDNNDQGQGGGGALGGGGAVTTISPDAIEEYRVISHNVPAEYGRAGGFATDTVLKSGSKTWHGSLFEYNRVQALAADDFFSKQAGITDHLVRNQFGGSVGGPIYKNKTFFYATVELHRRRQTTPATGLVTTQDFLDFVSSGDFEKFQEGTILQDPSVSVDEGGGLIATQQGLCPLYAGTTCPGALSKSATLGPVFQNLVKAEPTAFPVGTANATNLAAGAYTGGAIVYPVNVYATATRPISDALNQNRGSLKLDHKLGEKDQLSFAYLLDLFTETNSAAWATGYFGPSGENIGGAQNFSAAWTHTVSPTLLNVFRAGYLRHVSNFDVPGTTGVPELVPVNEGLAAGFGAADSIPQYFTENEFLYQDSITKTLAHHSVKAGFQYIRTRNGSSFDADKNGTLEVWDLENLLTDATLNDQFEQYAFGGPGIGSIYAASAAWDQTDNTMPEFYRGYRAKEFATYLQDDWKVNQQLTLNLGVRWDYFGPPHNFKKGYDSDVYFGSFGVPTANGNPFIPQIPLAGALQGANFKQVDHDIWHKDYKSFSPHIGFSLDPTGKGKLAIRGGFGIGYDRLYNNAYENIRFNFPKFSDNSIGYGTAVLAGALLQPGLYQVPFTANSLFQGYGGKPVPRHVDQRLMNAYYEQQSLGFEYQVRNGYVWETNYVGTEGRKLIGLNNINAYPGEFACPVSGAPYAASSPCGAAGYTNGFTSAHINTIFNGDNFRNNGFSSNYSALQTSLRKGYSNGLQFMANYTYSKALDQVSDVFTQRSNTAGTGPVDSYNYATYDYGPADFDMKHNLVVTLNYQEQWKKKNLLLGGWSISPIIKLQSGTPFTPYDSGNYNPIKDGRSGIDRTVYKGTGSVKNAITHDSSPATGYLKPRSSGDYFGPYTCPAGKLWCDPPAERNGITGPALKDLDLGVSKSIKTFEHQGFTLAGNFFNIFNHTNFSNPNADANSSNYGKSLSDAGPRVTQLSLRYDF
jgi:hypothetical protein